LRKLRRIWQAEVRRLKERLSPATVKLYLSKYRDAIRQIDPDHLVLRPRKMRSGQRFSYLALPPEETRRSTTGLMALTGRRPAEIFFSAKFSLPPKKLPFPALIF
jgi:hypothetical protein